MMMISDVMVGSSEPRPLIARRAGRGRGQGSQGRTAKPVLREFLHSVTVQLLHASTWSKGSLLRTFHGIS